MADIKDEASRSRNMRAIRGTDTKPEILVRRGLHSQGFRFRLHRTDLPGRPDLVLPRYRAVVFVHGCFWHRHVGCRYASTPATRADFWALKFAANVERDRRVRSELLTEDWRVATIWECCLRAKSPRATAIGKLADWIRGGDISLMLPDDMARRRLCQSRSKQDP